MLLFTEAGSGALDAIRSNSLVKASPHSLSQYSEPLRLQKHSDTLVSLQFPYTAIPFQGPSISARPAWAGPEPISPDLGPVQK